MMTMGLHLSASGIYHTRYTFAAVILLGLVAFPSLLAIFWVGFLGSDDAMYWEGATGWLTHVPYVGDTHWALRHTLVIPIALARLVLGDGMPALVAPTVIYALGVIVVLVVWTQRVAGTRAVVVVIAMVITNPQFVLLSSTATIDIVEMFFILSAFFLIDRAMGRIRNACTPWRTLLLAGGLGGLALLSRETTIFAVAAVSLLFLAGAGMDRRYYLLVGVGFAATIGLELAYLWAMTDNPFYRIAIAIHHDSSIDRWADQGATIPLVQPVIDPITMLLLNHNFGLLAWIGVPLVVWLARCGALTVGERRLVVLLGTLALTWTILAAGLWTMLPLIPRYYLLPSLLVSVLSGLALVRLREHGRPQTALFLGILLVSANLFALAADNRNYMFGEHVLVDLALATDRTIHTDPQTLRRSARLLDWKRLANRAVSTPPGTGDLFLYNPARADPTLRPASDWSVVERRQLSEGAVRRLACGILAAALSSWASLGRPGCQDTEVTLYRLP